MGQTVREKLAVFFGFSPQIIGLLFMMRLLVDTGFRMLYPFIPQFSAGLQLGIAGFGWLLFVRSSTGVAGPVLGVLADRFGRRKVMAASLLSQGLGMLGVALLPGWWTIGPMILYGAGATAFIPAQQAYISDQVAYARRGRALASVDTSFSIAGIAGLPLVGWLIETYGWRTPFLALGALSLAGAVMAWRQLPPSEPLALAHQTLAGMRKLVLRPNVLACVAVGATLFFAYSLVLTVWGIWFSADFGLDALALGWVGTSIALAELGGVTLSGLLIDRIGKKHGTQAGLLLAAALLAGLAFSRTQLVAAWSLLVVLGGVFEFSIVSLLTLFTEQVPEARATLLSLAGLGVSLGMGLGSPVTIWLWGWGGLAAVCTLGAVTLLCAALLVWRGLLE